MEKLGIKGRKEVKERKDGGKEEGGETHIERKVGREGGKKARKEGGRK